MMRTRWSHLSDEELWGYKDLNVEQDTTMMEELFNRLEDKIDCNHQIKILEDQLQDMEVNVQLHDS
jgi:hypothetical protein